MQKREVSEKDWKLFRNKISNWQEAYMDKLIKEYIKLLSEDANPSDRFWKLEKRINEDRKRTGVSINMRRSNMVYSIISLINEGAISFADLNEFSDELKETISIFIEI